MWGVLEMKTVSVDMNQLSEDYRRIERAILFLEKHASRQPELKEVADSVGLSEYHFQRIFMRWVGISPKRFLQYLTKERAKEMLRSSRSLLDVSIETGLSGPSRLHDLFVTYEAVTPGEYKSRGAGLEIVYGFHPSPFGECLVAAAPRCLCFLAFVQDSGRETTWLELLKEWPQAEFREDHGVTGALVQQIFAFHQGVYAEPLRVYLQGTKFQLKVWEALLRVPAGSVISYRDLAIQIGLPDGARAVGNAVGRNPLPVVIPCHRVIRGAGEMGGYRWGTSRKKALLAWEWSRFVEGERLGI